MAKMTVQRLADLLGLSGAAVSMALHGQPGVSEETRRRVLEAAQQYGYVPPQRTARRSKRSSKSPQDFCPVLLVLRSGSRTADAATFFSEMLEELERLAGGLLVYYIDPPDCWGEEGPERIRRINESASVVLLQGVQLDRVNLEKILTLLQPPAVVFDRDTSGLPVSSVSMDNQGIIRAAVQQLVEQGYKRFAFLQQEELTLPNHLLRREGYRQAAAENPEGDFIELTIPNIDGRGAFAEAVRGRICFSAQDGTAVAAYQLLGEAAKDTVLGGFDNFPLLQVIQTPAFTFRYQMDTVCRWAMELARSASAEPYLPPVHLTVSAPMLCYHFDPENHWMVREKMDRNAL